MNFFIYCKFCLVSASVIFYLFYIVRIFYSLPSFFIYFYLLLFSYLFQFTPDGQSVTIKIRKINPVQGLEKHVKRKSFTDTFDTFKSIINKKMASSFTSQSCSNSMAVNRKNSTDNYPNDIENNIHVSNNDSNDKNEDNFLWRNYYKKLPKFQKNNNKHDSKESKLHENGALYNCDKFKKIDISGEDNDQIVYDQSKHIYGTLIIDIIDSGVGMALEDANRLFKEIVQFNPGELQVKDIILPVTIIYNCICIYGQV